MQAIRLFVLFSFITSLAIAAIVVEYVPFLLEIGFSLSEVALLGLGYSILIAFIEVPSGIFADIYGCKRAVQLSQTIYCCGICFYGLASSRYYVFIAVPVTALSFALQSGARQAWMVSQLSIDTHPTIVRRAFADSALASQCGAILAPMLASAVKTQWSLNCFFLSGILSTVALCVTVFWSNDTPKHRERRGWKTVFHEGSKVALRYPLLRWLGWLSLVFSLLSVITNLWSPVLRESSWELDGYWVWFAMQLGLMIGSVAYRLLPSDQAPLAMVIALAIVGLSLMQAVRTPDTIWVGLLMVMQMARAFFQIARDHLVQITAPKEVRVTAASWISLTSQVGTMLVLGGMSIAMMQCVNSYDAMSVTWMPAGFVLCVSSVFFYLRYRSRRSIW